jgi:hypothetical protein
MVDRLREVAASSPIDLLLPLVNDVPDLSALQDGISWQTIKQCCGEYGVAAQVAYAARLHVTREEREWCDRILSNSWIRHERMLKHVENLAGLLSGEGIQTISLKGPLLARRYYAIPFLRKASMDVDLAVREKDLERAVTVLAGEGYRLSDSLAFARARDHHAVLTHPKRPNVELHFRLSHMALGIAVDEFFERSIPFRLPNGQEAQVLAGADQLLHLALHLTQSRFGTLFHLCEVRRVLKAESPEVAAEAIRRAVGHHFTGAIRMMDIAFRARWNERFIPEGVEIPRTWLHRRLTPELYRAFERWSIPGRGLSLAARLHGRWLDLQLTDGLSDAARAAIYFTRSAQIQLGRGAWGTVKHLRFAAPAVPSVEPPATQPSRRV